MNHPTDEQWMDVLYGEASPEFAALAHQHAESCEPCRNRLSSWKAARARLQEARPAPSVPAVPQTRRSEYASGLRAAAAIALVLGGVALGWAVRDQALDRMRGEWTEDLRGQLRRELAAFSQQQEARQTAFQETLTSTLGLLEGRRLADQQALRQELETLAVQSADAFAGTRQALARMSSTP